MLVAVTFMGDIHEHSRRIERQRIVRIIVFGKASSLARSCCYGSLDRNRRIDRGSAPAGYNRLSRRHRHSVIRGWIHAQVGLLCAERWRPQSHQSSAPYIADCLFCRVGTTWRVCHHKFKVLRFWVIAALVAVQRHGRQ